MRLRRRLWSLLATVLLLVVLFTFVFPTRTFLAQRAAISRAEHQLEVLEEQSAELEERAERLRSDAEVERLARERYNLVRPGEEAYAFLPGPDATPVPTGEAAADEADRNLLERAWDALSGLF